MKVLVIDDEPGLRSAISSALEDFNFEVSTASDGQEGLNLLAKHDFDVVVTDIFMPEKDGIEVVTQLKKMKEKKNVRIFAMSGGGKYGIDMLSLAPGLGAEAIFRKPFPIEDLVSAIQKNA